LFQVRGENHFSFHFNFFVFSFLFLFIDSTLYNTGENLLHLTHALGDQSILSQYNVQSSDEKAVFYDLFFFKLIVYTGWTVFSIHSLIVLLGISTIVFIMKQSNGRITWKTLSWGIRDELLTQGIIILSAVVYGVMAHYFFPMRWYNGGMGIAILEFFPIILLVTFVHRAYFILHRGMTYTNPILRQLSCLSLWTIISVISIGLGVMSGFIVCLWVFFLSIASLVYWYLKKLAIQQYSVQLRKESDSQTENNKNTDKEKDLDICSSELFSLIGFDQNNNNSFTSYLFTPEFWYLLILSPKLLLTHRYYDATMTMLIPLFGKTGSTASSDILIAATITGFIAPASGALLANDLKTKLSKSFVVKFSTIVFLIWRYVMMTTPAYSSERPKRLWIQHVTREYRNVPEKERNDYFVPLSSSLVKSPSSPSSSAGKEVTTDYGLWVISFDSQGFHPIQSYIASYTEVQQQPKTNRAEPYQTVSCENSNGHCYSMFPWYFPVAEVLKDSYYLPTSHPPLIAENEKFQLFVSSHPMIPKKSEPTKTTSRMIEIILVGPSHMHLVLRDPLSSSSSSSSNGKLPLKDRIVRWYLDESLPSSVEMIEKTISVYRTNHQKKPVYSESRLLQLQSSLQETVSPIRWDNIYFFEIGSGLCPSHVCMKRVYLEVTGNEEIDVIGYGHYVEKAKIDEKRYQQKKKVKSGETVEKETRSQEEKKEKDPIDEFLNHLPDWSKGAEWTKFPSSLIVERI
jgi:hypothetical protein